MGNRLDSLFGLKKHHRLIKKDARSTEILKELVDYRSTLIQLRKEGVFRESNLFAIQHCMRTEKNKNRYYCNLFGVARTVNYKHLPLAAAWVEEFAQEQKGALGWALFSILEPKSLVHEHSDSGLYFAMRDRYHFVLQTDGSKMLSGGETQTYREGEVWWFNNRVPHEAFNESEHERIHLIFDVLPNNWIARIKNLLLWLYWGLRPRRLWRYYFGRKFPQF